MNKNGKQVINQVYNDASNDLLPGLYMHWPYCVSKCPYCDFNSHVRQVFDERQYVEAICSELEYLATLQGDRDCSKPLLGSIFFGGGTPSLMQPETVGALLDYVRSRFSLVPDVEITLEANPSSVEAARFQALGGAGINRVSLGVQALHDKDLQVLGRAHGVNEALAAVALAQQSFARSSFDLIYGRHGQQLAQWRDELKRGIDLSNGHLSLYQLTIEEGTQYKNLFDRGELNLPSNDRSVRFFEETRNICEAAGLDAYEISNYAAAGEQSRHNLVYWRYGTYMGVGPGAHGRIERGGHKVATAAIRSPKRWMAQVKELGHGIETMDKLLQSEMADEMLLMGLRLTKGVDLAHLQALCGRSIKPQKINELVSAGLCEMSEKEDFFRVSDRGICVLNQIVAQLSGALDPV
ncbi:MAG: coproporphyrinogen III oxidase [bacterium]|nr:coproporphyrinogen III oxidase [bacterium]